MSSINVKPNTHDTSVPVKTWYDTINGWHVPVYITWEHARIHEGKSWNASVLWGDGNEVADNASVYMLAQVGSAAHAIYDVASGGNCEVHLYQNPTFSDQGTLISSFNKNPNSTETTGMVLSHTPTFSDKGTQLPSRLLPGGVKAAGSGGQDGSFNREIILKGGDTYMMEVKNFSGAIQPVSIAVEWYES